MCRYRVNFFKNLLSIDGHLHKCLQQSIVIRRAKSAERAVEAAKRRYVRHEQTEAAAADSSERKAS
jgi:hypothetical protein